MKQQKQFEETETKHRKEQEVNIGLCHSSMKVIYVTCQQASIGQSSCQSHSRSQLQCFSNCHDDMSLGN